MKKHYKFSLVINFVKTGLYIKNNLDVKHNTLFYNSAQYIKMLGFTI